jgi:hypothetical protein
MAKQINTSIHSVMADTLSQPSVQPDEKTNRKQKLSLSLKPKMMGLLLATLKSLLETRPLWIWKQLVTVWT